jgi:hypothetical protein
LSWPQGHSAAWRITPIKNSSDTIGNRTRDFSACSAVPQPNCVTACADVICILYIIPVTLLCQTKYILYCFIVRGRYSVVGIATRYGLDGPGIDSRWGRDFPHPSRPALGPTQLPVRWVPGLSQGWPPTPIYVPRSWMGRAIPLLTLWAFVACYRENFTFTFYCFIVHLSLHVST